MSSLIRSAAAEGLELSTSYDVKSRLSFTSHVSISSPSSRHSSNLVAPHSTRPHELPLRYHWASYLQKRSDWLKHWETYYFVLRGHFLYCYLSEEDARRQNAKSKIKKGKFGFSDRVSLVKAWDVEEVVNVTMNGSVGITTSSTPVTGSACRFTLVTRKGHHLHFRTTSQCSDYARISKIFIKPMSISILHFVLELRLMKGGSSLTLSLPSKKSASSFLSFTPNQSLTKTNVVAPMDHALVRFFSLLKSDVIVRSNYLPMVPFEGKFRGFSGILEYFTRLSQSVQVEQFLVESICIEQDEEETSESNHCHSRARNRVVIISGRETMQVRYNQTTFVQQWTHKLHFKPNDGGRVSRWEIYGDVVASSVVFKAPGCTTNLTLPSLAERIRESVVGGYVVSIHLYQITDVRSKELQGDEFFVRCSLDTNEFEGVWHTEAQSRAAAPIECTTDSNEVTLSWSYNYDQELFLQFDRLSRDDNTVLLIECCRCSNHEVVARTHVNLASFLNNSNQSCGSTKSSSTTSNRLMGRRSRSKAENVVSHSDKLQSYVLSNDHQSFFGKLQLRITISSMSQRSRSQRASYSSFRRSFRSSYSDDNNTETLFPESSSTARASFRSLTKLTHHVSFPGEEVMHQFVINGVRYQLAEKYRMVKIVGKGTYGEVIAASDFVHGGTPSPIKHSKNSLNRTQFWQARGHNDGAQTKEMRALDTKEARI
ncbi:cmgc mapk protein kinase [Plasmopara halstedii]|uniref:Cmgc mapk protein kinase n=1 Tax=Plasmopara halstedii TaxID=4781 RepID=A0A0P1ARW4_PLAHL|nr:cmgc mapk protein kinase [Plasmopara halstedii]CEG44381.1 cmgc mapk protein kinase [Plasmopara halstedii]|eukprot:XP_024580750.1 cmgc mapk protein kinase [Plasmopara halstedii]